MTGVVAHRYTRVAVALHWAVAALMIGNVVLVWTISLLPEAAVRPAVNMHKSIGLTVLGLGVLRLLWRFGHRPPAAPRRYPLVERAGAAAAHVLLYGLILGLPITGYIHDSAFSQAAAHPLTLFGLVTVPRWPSIMALDPAAKERVHAFWFSVHSWLGWALYGLLALHVAGALKHQFVDGEAEFPRMAFGRRT